MKKFLLLLPALLLSAMLVGVTGCGEEGVSQPDKVLPKPENVERPQMEGTGGESGGMAVEPEERP